MIIDYKLLKSLNADLPNIERFINTYDFLDIPDDAKVINLNDGDVNDILWLFELHIIKDVTVRFKNLTIDINPNGYITRYNWADGLWYNYEYDSNNNITKYERSSGYAYTNIYNEHGDVVTCTFNSDVTTTEYDDNRNIIRCVTGTGRPYVGYRSYVQKFDDNGNLLVHYNLREYNWYIYEYDERGNLIRCDMSDGTWYISEYDERGNKIYTNWDGENYVRYVYDEHNNNIEVIWSDGTHQFQTFDERGNMIKSIYGKHGSYSIWEYDDDDNLIRFENESGEPRYDVKFTFEF